MIKKVTALLLALVMVWAIPAFTYAEEATFTVTPPSEGVELYADGVKITEGTQVTGTEKLAFKAENALVISTEYGCYLPEAVFYATGDLDFSKAYPVCDTGLTLISGAQVRVGNVELSEEGKLDATADSGLRFIATANYTDTLIAEENVVFGIKVNAEQSDNSVYVEAEQFQNTDNTVFTAAITNLSTNNYNRKYTATTYAIVTLANGEEVEFNSGEVTRSVYQVSAGIMKNSSAEGADNMTYTIDETVKSVLNAYINQTGIRLIYSRDGSMSESTAYTGDVFFNVEYVVNDDNSTTVTITPKGAENQFYNSVTIADWWRDYIRVNNSNSAVQWYIRNETTENGVLTFTFKIPDYKFNQEDNVMIVSSVTEDEISGYEAGVLKTYPLSDEVDIWGLGTSMDDIVPGCVVLLGKTDEGVCGGIELLASIGIPVDPDVFEADFGVYTPTDGSTKYKNVVNSLFAKSRLKITCKDQTVYNFKNSSVPCYRVGIAMSGETPVITVKEGMNFESTSEYDHYMYLRCDTATGKIVQCVFYCVPKNLDFSGDGEYSDIFSLDNYKVIIE